MLDWEKKIIHDVFGMVDKDGLRKYRTVYIEVPKKNGKSPFASGIAAYMLCADGEPTPEVYSCAVDKEQSSIIYEYMYLSTKPWTALRRKLKYIESQKSIKNNSNDGKYKALSADVPSKHGVSPSCIVFDELHAQPNRKLWSVMTKGSMATREQPLLIIITTAGLDIDRTSICWEVRQRALRVLNGESTEDDFYAVIYGLGEDKDWEDPDYWKKEKNWHKANPSLGKTIKIEDMRAEFNSTINSMEDEEEFKQFRLNIWVNQRSVTWLPIKDWDKGNIPFNIDDLKGKKCYAGLDVASTTDLTALLLLFPEAGADKRDILLPFFWIPEENMLERIKRDKISYNKWVKEGYITATPGNVIDQDYIEAEITRLSKLYKILELGYDRHDTSMLVTHLERKNIIMVGVNQRATILTPTIRDVERNILGNKYQHAGNPVLRWNFRNILIKRHPNKNLELKKVSENLRIDGIDALVDAENRRTANVGTASVYESKGVTVI